MTKRRKFTKLMMTLMVTTALFMGCSSATTDKSESTGNSSVVEVPQDKLPVATITVKDFGTIEAELYPNVAPITVNNFIELANSGFYDGLTYHRIIKDFMIQGGDPNGTGTGGPGYSIKGEFKNNGHENNLKHEEGVLSMARSQAPDSAGSQFFIVTKAAPHLDGEYASFGKITSGLDVLHNIENVETGAQDRPITPVVIESIKVDTKGITYNEAEKLNK